VRAVEANCEVFHFSELLQLENGHLKKNTFSKRITQSKSESKQDQINKTGTTLNKNIIAFKELFDDSGVMAVQIIP